jgi:membrane associated rhomboid family serine protease
MYFGALLGGSLAVLSFGFSQPTLGASGAVLGLAGAMFVVLWGRGISVKDSPVFGLVVINLLLPLLIPGISFWGHFGGVVAGGLMAFLMVWLPEKNRSGKEFQNLSLGIATLILLLVACFIVV